LQRTPLHWAARCNQSDMAINLMKLGVEFELQDFESKRAVEVATDNGYTVLASSITQHHQFAEKKKKLMKLQS
jgi:ankyrin repeat protein